MIRCISFSRPTQGSSRPSAAARVRSVPKVSSTGVFEFCFFCVVVVAPDFLEEPDAEEDPEVSSNSSSSSSGRPIPLVISVFFGA